MAVQIAPLFAPTVLTASAAAIFTAPASPPTITISGMKVRFTNTSNATVSVTAYAVPSGGTAGPGNCCANAEPIAPNTHLDLVIPVLGLGGIFEALASTASEVTVTQLSGTIFS